MAGAGTSGRPVYVTPSETIALLKEHGIWLRKGLGQHFLVDNNVVLNILDAALLEPTDVVLEVGSGIGTLTKGLADRAARVIAVEVDDRLATCFRANVTATNVILLRADAMKLTRGALAAAGRTGAALPNKLVANLPYNIAAPLVLHLLDIVPELAVMLIMVQREIADRMAAPPGNREYGALTAKLSFYGKVDRVFAVPASVFLPTPRVQSAVVRIARREADLAQREAVFTVIDAAFSQRRKKLANALTAGLAGGLSRQQIGDTLRVAGIDPGVRAEQLSADDFARIAKHVRASR